MRIVERWKWIKRDDLQHYRNLKKIFLFGDNLEHVGMGGQAKEMRGEPNAIGIPTKPSIREFWSDATLEENRMHIDEAFAKIPDYVVVVVPEAGIGTGLAELPTRAPKTQEYINASIEALHKPVGTNIKGHEVKLLSSGYVRIVGKNNNWWQGKWPPKDRRAYEDSFFPTSDFDFRVELGEVYDSEVGPRIL